MQRQRRFAKVNDVKVLGTELWIAGKQLHRLSLTKDGQNILQTKTFSTNKREVTALNMDSKGNIYLGFKGEGLYYLSKEKGHQAEFIKVFGNNDPHRIEELPFKNIHHISFIPRSAIVDWFL